LRSCEFPVQLVDCKFAGMHSCEFPVKLVDCKFAGMRSCEFHSEGGPNQVHIHRGSKSNSREGTPVKFK
jgi:hypothetical protein